MNTASPTSILCIESDLQPIVQGIEIDVGSLPHHHNIPRDVMDRLTK